MFSRLHHEAEDRNRQRRAENLWNWIRNTDWLTPRASDPPRLLAEARAGEPNLPGPSVKTVPLYYEDPYLRTFNSAVATVEGDRLVLEESAFYPRGGGQPSDQGVIEFNGTTSRVVNVSRKGAAIVHTVQGDLPAVGQEIKCLLDWDLRYRYMRLHTALHALSAVVLNGWNADVTGGNIADGGAKARMDFSLEGIRINDILDEVRRNLREELTRSLPVKTYEIAREEAVTIPGLIRTHINLLPKQIRQVRIVEIEGLDIQADGGTHVSNTREVGLVNVLGGSNKGRINRRIEIALDDPPTAKSRIDS